MKTTFNILFQMAIMCSFGFILNYLFFKMILFGVLGSKLQLFLLDKFRYQDFSWLNKFLFYFLIIYFILISTGSTIYLDSNNEVVVNLSNVVVTVKETFFEKVLSNLGGGIAFAAGAKLTANFLIERPMPVIIKIVASLLAAIGSFIIFHLLNLGAWAIKDYLSATKVTDKSFIFHIKDVEINNLPSPKSLDFLNNLSVNNKELLKQKIESHLPNNEMIEKTSNENLTEISNQDNQTVFDTFRFNSPLENSEDTINLYNELSLILGYNLILNIITVYFICMLTLVFTIKFSNKYRCISR